MPASSGVNRRKLLHVRHSSKPIFTGSSGDGRPPGRGGRTRASKRRPDSDIKRSAPVQVIVRARNRVAIVSNANDANSTRGWDQLQRQKLGRPKRKNISASSKFYKRIEFVEVCSTQNLCLTLPQSLGISHLGGWNVLHSSCEASSTHRLTTTSECPSKANESPTDDWHTT